MIAQIKSINMNATKQGRNGKTLTGVEFTYQGTPYNGQVKDPTTRFLFSNSPIVPALQSCQPGDWVEIKFDNTKYKNPESLTKTSAPQANPPQGGGSKKGGWNDEDTQRRISRSAAMKEATTIVLAKSKASAKVADIVDEVKSVTRELERFLNFKEEEAGLEGNTGVAELPEDDIPF